MVIFKTHIIQKNSIVYNSIFKSKDLGLAKWLTVGKVFTLGSAFDIQGHLAPPIPLRKLRIN